jgi:hypothetical protein
VFLRASLEQPLLMLHALAAAAAGAAHAADAAAAREGCGEAVGALLALALAARQRCVADGAADCVRMLDHGAVSVLTSSFSCQNLILCTAASVALRVAGDRAPVAALCRQTEDTAAVA